MLLFSEEELYGGKDESPPDGTHINMTPLYFSNEELDEYKKLCKAGMQAESKEFFEGKHMDKGNISDFLIKLLRKHYGHLIPTKRTSTSTQIAAPFDGGGIGADEGQVS